MISKFVMPKLGHLMEEGKIVRWKKKEGDFINKGEVLLEIETDKAEIEIDSEISGVIIKIMVQEGETVPVGLPLMLYEEKE
ncbi:MAG: biotin/lipoyl-containing protein [bacterium]